MLSSETLGTIPSIIAVTRSSTRALRCDVAMRRKRPRPWFIPDLVSTIHRNPQLPPLEWTRTRTRAPTPSGTPTLTETKSALSPLISNGPKWPALATVSCCLSSMRPTSTVAK